MVVYLNKSKRFVECVEVFAVKHKTYNNGVEYLDVKAELTSGKTMSLCHNNDHVAFVNGHYEPVVTEDTLTVKEVWEKVHKALLTGKAVSLPM